MATVARIELVSATGRGSSLFSVVSAAVPLSEVLETYCEVNNLSVCQTKLLLNGEQISPYHSLMQLSYSKSIRYSPETTISFTVVETTGTWSELEKSYFALNQLQSKLAIGRPGTRTLPIPPELFSIILSYLDVAQLQKCAVVCVYWNNFVHQYSMLCQIELGLFSWHSKLNYPYWLAQMGELSWKLAMSSSEKQKIERDSWLPMNLHKEKPYMHHYLSQYGRPYQFTKAAGCVIVESVVQISSEDESVIHNGLGRHKPCNTERIKFLKTINNSVSVRGSKNVVNCVNTDCEQLFPERGSTDFITPARHQDYFEVVKDLFRRYFSPDMYYIFPLLVYKQEQFGLDFSSTETWLIFGYIPEDGPIPNQMPITRSWMKDPEIPENMAYPHGAVSWRFCLPIDFGIGKSAQCGLLEVMFIAVWEEERGHELGSSLVRELEKEARRNSVSLLYVEIGHEQEKAKTFWSKNGFKPVKLSEYSKEDEEFCYFTTAQSRFCDTRCLRFADTQQYIRWIQ